MDIKSSEERSKNMSHIKAQKTRIEMYVRKLLYADGFRYRVNYKNIEGKPDLYFIGRKTAIFVNGCFWHRHKNCRIAYTPKSNIDFWQKKFESNIKRDIIVQSKLREKHIRYLIIWECTIKQMQKNEEMKKKVLNEIEKFIKTDTTDYLEL